MTHFLVFHDGGVPKCLDEEWRRAAVWIERDAIRLRFGTGIRPSERIVGSNSELIHLSRMKAGQRHFTDAVLHGEGAGPLAGYDDPTLHHVTYRAPYGKYLAAM